MKTLFYTFCFLPPWAVMAQKGEKPHLDNRDTAVMQNVSVSMRYARLVSEHPQEPHPKATLIILNDKKVIGMDELKRLDRNKVVSVNEIRDCCDSIRGISTIVLVKTK